MEKIEENSNNNVMVNNTDKMVTPKKSYHFDILTLILWLVLMWGFLLLLTVTNNPPDRPGIHMFLTLTYFLGFTFIYAIYYILALKKGV